MKARYVSFKYPVQISTLFNLQTFIFLSQIQYPCFRFEVTEISCVSCLLTKASLFVWVFFKIIKVQTKFT